MTQPLPRPHSKVGKYEIVEKIGEGGYSIVYRGFDPLIKRSVAIKSCSSADREVRERFYREAEIAGNLDHPNIIRIYDLLLEGDTPYLVQEFLDGEDLDDRIERREPAAFAEKLYHLIQIARGLAYAHSRGVIHRDIKPSNIRVLEDGSAKILDFGIAKLAHFNSNLTQAGMAVGTAAYLAPEQIRGEKAGPATDIFSFGVMAYELLTLVRPFGRETISETFYQTLNSIPAPVTVHWPDCPPEVVSVISDCLHKDPARRFSSCDQVRRRLEAIRDQMRGERAPRIDPGKTQRISTRVPSAPPEPTVKRLSDAQQFETPKFEASFDTSLKSRPTPRVDLPLQARAQSVRTPAGVGRRKASWRKWVPYAFALATGAALAFAASSIDVSPLIESLLATSTAASSPVVSESTPSIATAIPSALSELEPEPAPDLAQVQSRPVDETARADTVAPAQPGTARVTFSNVWNPAIQVSIDGGQASRISSSKALDLRPGAHSLTFSLETNGYRATQTVDLEVSPGQSRSVKVPIRPPGRLSVQAHLGSPQGLVRIGTQRLLKPTPLRGQALKPGRHRVAIFSHEDRTTPASEVVLEVRSGHESIVTFDLEGNRAPHVREKDLR